MVLKAAGKLQKDVREACLYGFESFGGLEETEIFRSRLFLREDGRCQKQG